jgi:hypothetical protein
MVYILFNIKNNTPEIIDKKKVLDNLYYLEYRPITSEDINNINNKELKQEILNNPNIISEMKRKISKIEEKVPLFDTYSNNIFLISKHNVYERVVNQYYRFPEKELIENLEERKKKLNKKNNLDILQKRELNKIELMIKFMEYFDIDILYETYIKVFYKYSAFVGKEITTCYRPSFLPQFHHLRPYFTRSEIINIGLNMGIDIDKNYENYDYNDIKLLCNKISKNEMDFNILLKHKEYMINKKSLGMIQFYTLQGSYMMNQYLRNKVTYKQKNEYLEKLIHPVWELIKKSPEFDKNYTLYRFIQNDDYLIHLKINDIYIEDGFMSTTRNPFYNSDSYQFGFILLKINIPKNKNGVALCLETISHFPEEQEIIFPPLSKFKLIKKDEDCIYYHTDINFSSKIKTRYEFDWIENEEIKFKREGKDNIIVYNVNFLNLERKLEMTLINKIKFFENYYVNNMGQFKITIGKEKKEFIVLTEWFDSTGAYEKFYSKKTPNGYSIYSIYDNYILFFIELIEVEFELQMHVNYYVKYSAIEPNKIIGDENLIFLYSSIAYYFDIHNVFIYANYMNCDISSNEYEQEHKSKIFGGSYCVDFYQYFTTNKKRYSELNILNNELHPLFSYYELDTLKTISPKKILHKEDNEIYQVYEKIYLDKKNLDNIIDFYIWLKNHKCYLLDGFISSIDRLLGKNNPFKNDVYELDPISYLYNRKYIKIYSSRFKIIKNIERNIFAKNVKKQKNERDRNRENKNK